MDHPVSRNLHSKLGYGAWAAGSLLAILMAALLVWSPNPKASQPEPKPPDYASSWAKTPSARRSWTRPSRRRSRPIAGEMRSSGPGTARPAIARPGAEALRDGKRRMALKALLRVAPDASRGSRRLPVGLQPASASERLYDDWHALQALPLFEKALEIRRRLLSDDNPQTAESYDKLARNFINCYQRRSPNGRELRQTERENSYA